MQFLKNGCDALSGCCHRIKLMLLCGYGILSKKLQKKVENYHFLYCLTVNILR